MKVKRVYNTHNDGVILHSNLFLEQFKCYSRRSKSSFFLFVIDGDFDGTYLT